jgi:hypothetical protein
MNIKIELLMVQENLSFKSNQIEKDAIEIESGQIITTLFHIQMKLQVNRDVIKIDTVIIEHNHNRLVTAV